MPSIDSVRGRTPRLPTTQDTPPPRRSNRRGSGVAVLVLLAVGGFFLLTHPSASTSPPAKADAAVTPATAVNRTADSTDGIQISLPQPDAKSSLKETVILDSPLPDSQKQTQSTSTSATTSSTATTTPATVQPGSFTTRILNGSGNAGIAATKKDALTKAGFNVTSVGTAVNSYTKSVIYYTAGHQAAAQVLKDALTNSTATLIENDVAKPADVLYVVGKNEA